MSVLRFIAVTHEVSKFSAIGVAYFLEKVVHFLYIKSVLNAEIISVTHDLLMTRLHQTIKPLINYRSRQYMFGPGDLRSEVV